MTTARFSIATDQIDQTLGPPVKIGGPNEPQIERITLKSAGDRVYNRCLPFSFSKTHALLQVNESEE
jgi:hypothetical protein